jgi:hypothetical protein
VTPPRPTPRRHSGPLLALLGALACRPPPAEPPRPARPDPLTLLTDRCERGDGPACVEVAAAHYDADAPERAAAYARRACDLASARGCAQLADQLDEGDGLPADRGRALELYVSACLGGHGPACRSAADRLPAAEAAQFRARACAAGEAALCPPAATSAPPAPAVDPRDAAGVVNALATRRRALWACYRRALADKPGLRGRVVVDVAVGADGRPRAVAVHETLRAAPDVGACVAEVAAGTAYPPTTTGEIVVVPYRVTFEPAP